MEAWQHAKLSLTNRSTGLISLIPTAPVRSGKPAQNTGAQPNQPFSHKSAKRFTPVGLDDPVVMAKAQTPDPIPNSAVKSFSANGTAPQGVGE